MATQRRSTALFEVINKSQRSGRTGALSTPKWWFKSKVARTETAVAPAHSASSLPASVALSSSSETGSRYSHSRGRSAMHFDFDRDRQEITIRMRYTTAIVSAFAVLVVIGLSYTVGRRVAVAPAATYASATTEQLMHMPADPSAMDVPTRTSTILPASGTTHLAPLIATTGGAPITAPPAVSRTSMEINQPRSVGLNYIIVQSYNTEKLADEARDFLIKNNVPCTVEKISNFFTVISSAGYSHIHSTEFENAIKNITALGEQFGGKNKFKRFDPYGYKWKATS